MYSHCSGFPRASDLSKRGCDFVMLTLRVCAPAARNRVNSRRADSSARKYSLRVSTRADLEVVRPNQLLVAPQRPFLVVD